MKRPGASLSSLQWIIGLAMLAIAGVLRFYLLDRQAIWNDESFSLDVARSPIGELMLNLRKYHHPPLFFVFLHYSLKLLGDNPWTLRVVSALSGALTCSLAYFIAARVFQSNISGVIAGALCTLSPFHLAYSQEGRPYALAALFCLVNFYYFWLCVKEIKPWNGVLYILSSIALLYVHHWGIFFILTQVIFVLLRSDVSWSSKKTFLLLWSVVGLCYLPEAFELRRKLAPLGPVFWFWVEKPNPFEIIQIGGAYSGSYFKFASAIFIQPHLLQILGITSVFTLGLVPLLVSGKNDALTSLRIALVCFLGTLFIPFAISFSRPEIFLWYRYTVIVFPLFCVIAGGFARDTKSRYFVFVIVLILLFVECFGALRYYSWSKSNTKEVVSYVEDLSKRGYSPIVRPKYYAPLLNYYYRANTQQADETYLDGPLGEIVDTTRSLIYISLDSPNEIRDYIDKHFEKVEQRVFPGEAHMGIIVGAYRQKAESDTTGTSLSQ